MGIIRDQAMPMDLLCSAELHYRARRASMKPLSIRLKSAGLVVCVCMKGMEEVNADHDGTKR